MNKIGLVLSGGGARGFAHLGILKVLDELKIKPFAISGVSAGALVGALYASGKSPDEIIGLIKGNSNIGFSNLLWRKEGLFSMEFIRRILIENIPENSFESLKIPLFVNATDLLCGKTVYFSKGELIPCLIASSSVPVIFEPVTFGNTKLVDGGLLNNLPIEPVIGICEKIIASHVNKLQCITDANIKFSKAAITERCFHLAISKSVYSKAYECDLFIEPEIENIGMFDLKDVDNIYEIGYKTALKERDKLLEMME